MSIKTIVPILLILILITDSINAQDIVTWDQKFNHAIGLMEAGFDADAKLEFLDIIHFSEDSTLIVKSYAYLGTIYYLENNTANALLYWKRSKGYVTSQEVYNIMYRRSSQNYINSMIIEGSYSKFDEDRIKERIWFDFAEKVMFENPNNLKIGKALALYYQNEFFKLSREIFPQMSAENFLSEISDRFKIGNEILKSDEEKERTFRQFILCLIGKDVEEKDAPRTIYDYGLYYYTDRGDYNGTERLYIKLNESLIEYENLFMDSKMIVPLYFHSAIAIRKYMTLLSKGSRKRIQGVAGDYFKKVQELTTPLSFYHIASLYYSTAELKLRSGIIVKK